MKGTVIQRGNGWSVVIDMPRQAGKRRQKWYSGYKTEEEASNALIKIQADLIDGIEVDDATVKVAVYLKRWLSQVKPQVRPSSYEFYTWAIERLVKELPDVQLGRLRPIQIQDAIARLQDPNHGNQKSLSGTSTKHVLKTLSMALDRAVKHGLLRTNPCDNVAMPRANEHSTTIFTNEQMLKFLNEIADTELQIPVTIAIACGMRRGEVCGLRWRDVDLDHHTLYVMHSLDREKGRGLVLKKVKTNTSSRTVTLPPSVTEMIRQERDRQISLGIHAEDGYVWCWPDGRPYDPDYLYHQYADKLADCNLPHARFHDLRHMHATMLLKAGVPLKVVSERLGHSSPVFTAKVYQHVLPAMQQAAATATENILLGSPECDKLPEK